MRQPRNGKSRRHIDICNLLDRYECRFQAETDKTNGNNDWRLRQYLKTIFDMLDEEEQTTGRLNDELCAARKKALFFHSLLEAQTKATLLDQYKAIASLPTLVGTDNTGLLQQKAQLDNSENVTIASSHKLNRTKTIHRKKIAQCEEDIRKELLGLSNTDDSAEKNDQTKGAKQKLHSGKNYDDIVKYHKLLQENVTNEMVALARSLKHNITVSNEIVKKDTELLERTNQIAEDQYSRLRVNTNKIKEFADMACEYWLWISLFIVTLTFLSMVIFIRIF